MLNEWMKKLDRLFENRRILFTFAFLAIFVESFSSVLLKMGGLYPVMSLGWAFFFCAAVGVMGIYAIMWQFLLEKLPLSTAYLRKGISYILVFIWAAVIFGETITPQQLIGAAIIIAGTVISQLGER